MYLQRLLQINIATLAALGAMLLGLGQRDFTMPTLVIVAAVLSIYLTDITGWFKLNRTVANIGGMIALCFSFSDLYLYFRYNDSIQVFGVANVLVYLQIILLFLEKDDRTYWQLIILSLLQVVVAAAFHHDFWFGILLILYMSVGLSALVLRHLCAQRQHYQLPAPEKETSMAGSRWPLAGQQPWFSTSPAGPSRLGVGRELLGRIAWIAAATIGATLLLFPAVPRFSRDAWRGVEVVPNSVVGFSPTVSLGEFGRIIENPAEVMRVELSSNVAGKGPPVRGAIYLRGGTLERYGDGQWEQADSGNHRAKTLDDHPDLRNRARSNRIPMWQTITIGPLDRRELFCIWPFMPVANEDVLYDARSRRLLRRSTFRAGRLKYTLGTTAIANRKQVPLMPYQPYFTLVRNPDETQEAFDARAERAMEKELDRFRQLPREELAADESGSPGEPRPKLKRVEQLAEEWISGTGIPRDQHYDQAKAFESAFLSRERFQYSLERQKRDSTMDPIEDFLTEHTQGHCEYFATALTLMLRSAGIPARMVIGYKTDEWNGVGKHYKVRQLHAHAWVEAYLSQDKIPEELFLGDPPERWKYGGWLRLEPTPGGDSDLFNADASMATRIKQRIEWFRDLWTNYVLDMDRTRQYAAVYGPLLDMARSAWSKLTDPTWWRNWVTALVEAANVTHWGSPGQSWVAVAIPRFLALGVLLFFGWRKRRFLGRVWRRLMGRFAPARWARRSNVEFYARMEKTLARHGLRRSPGQTHREFARLAAHHIAATTDDKVLIGLPEKVVEAFYRVRFGHLPLDKRQTEVVEQALARLARWREEPAVAQTP